MIPYAKSESINTSHGLKIFRYDTELRSKNGAGEPIGLVYMLNPGSAHPVNDELFKNLQTKEYSTGDYVQTISDTTMDRVINYIKEAYKVKNLKIPTKYSIHIENLFNIREKNSDQATKLLKTIKDAEHLMYKSREIERFKDKYHFVWFAWGSTNIRIKRQQELLNIFPNAIQVKKLNVKGKIRGIMYPNHPLYMRKEFFLEAAKDKIRS